MRDREREDKETEREEEVERASSTNLLCAVKKAGEYKHEYGNLYSYSIWRERGRKLMELKYLSYNSGPIYSSKLMCSQWEIYKEERLLKCFP